MKGYDGLGWNRRKVSYLGGGFCESKFGLPCCILAVICWELYATCSNDPETPEKSNVTNLYPGICASDHAISSHVMFSIRLTVVAAQEPFTFCFPLRIRLFRGDSGSQTLRKLQTCSRASSESKEFAFLCLFRSFSVRKGEKKRKVHTYRSHVMNK